MHFSHSGASLYLACFAGKANCAHNIQRSLNNRVGFKGTYSPLLLLLKCLSVFSECQGKLAGSKLGLADVKMQQNEIEVKHAAYKEMVPEGLIHLLSSLRGTSKSKLTVLQVKVSFLTKVEEYR